MLLLCLQISLPEAITPRRYHAGGVVYGEAAQVHLVLHGGVQGLDYDHPLAATTVIDLGMTKRGHSVSSEYNPTYYTCKCHSCDSEIMGLCYFS